MKILGPNDETFIYCLIHNNEVKYVGKSDNPEKRFKQHLRNCKYRKTYKDNWLKGLLVSSQIPELLVLDKVPFINFGFWEDFYINLFKTYGFKLTNLAPGGGGGNFGELINKKISEKKKGWVMSESGREKLRIYHTGLKSSEQTKRKLSKHTTGKNNPMYGVKREKEWDKNKRKKIVQLTLLNQEIKIWESINDASINTLTNRTSINYVLKNKRLSAGGYKWKYYDIY
jgi:group I intron endonuclease